MKKTMYLNFHYQIFSGPVKVEIDYDHESDMIDGREVYLPVINSVKLLDKQKIDIKWYQKKFINMYLKYILVKDPDDLLDEIKDAIGYGNYLNYGIK